MDATPSGDDSDAVPMSTDMLEDIPDSSQSRLRINIIEALYKIRGIAKLGQAEWKGALGKGLHRVFKTVVNDILQSLPILGESGS